MSEVVTIGKVKTPVIHYKGHRVCTTKQLADFYGSSQESIQKNYERNASRFKEGVHFFKVEGDELRQLKKDMPTISRYVADRTARLMLWTDKGAARHAKMLETDTAWDVYEEMEDSYFAKGQPRPAVTDGKDLSSKFDRLPLYHFVVETTIRHHLIFSRVYQLLNLFAGSTSFKEMTKEQIAAVADFCDRFALGQDTRNDWQRITDNQAKLHGTPAQLDMVQKLLLS